MASSHFPPLSAAILACLVSACSPRYIDGLEFVNLDGSTVGLSAGSPGSTAGLPAGTQARFVLGKPATVGPASDLAVTVHGSGRLSVAAYANPKAGAPLATATYDLHGRLPSELRLRIPGGSSIGCVELRAGPGSLATLGGFALKAPFVGARIGPDVCVVDGTTMMALDAEGRVASLRLAAPFHPASSIVARTAGAGRVGIVGLDGAGTRTAAFDATVRAGLDLAVPVAAFGEAQAVVVESSAGLALLAAVDGGGAPLSDLYAILAAQPPLGDYSIYRWDILPGTLVLDFIDYDTQDRYLKRLAFFAEKPGFRGRLATDDEIASLHGWNAHDYSTRTLSTFFGKVGKEGFPLKREELALLELLVDRGILVRGQDGTIGEGSGAIISISRESSAALRKTFIDHEASHALFFQDEDYRKLSAVLWSSLSRQSRRFWRLHFAWRRYDTADEYLNVNELQAYLVQQPLAGLAQYYEALIERLSEAYPDEAGWLEADGPAVIEAATAAAARLDGYLGERWGLSAGRFGRTRRSSLR